MSEEEWVFGKLAAWAEKTPDAPYLQSGDSDWLTYADVLRLSESVAAGLQRLGIDKGDRVAYLTGTRVECVIFFFAVARLGAISAPLNSFLRGEFLRYQLVDLQPAAVVVDGPGAQQLKTVAGDVPDLTNVILLDAEDDLVPAALPYRATSYAALASGTASADFPAVTPNDICSILYTGGTTGAPKGCLIPHSYAAAVAESLVAAGFAEVGDRLLTTYPYYHMGGIYAICVPLWVGGSLVYEPEFHASTFMSRAREMGATVVYGMGAMAMAMLAQPPKPDDSDNTVRLGYFLPMKLAAKRAFEERFGVEIVAELYGQTECVPVSLGQVHGERRLGSAGRVQGNFEVRIVDDRDRTVPDGEVGEIAVRPTRPGVMFAGYWNNPAATAETWRNLWHHTGDFGRVDADGFLHFVDRKKDAIRRRGEFVSTLELEQAILLSDDVAQVCVHAVPSELTEDDIKACIVLHPGRSATPESLFGFFRGALPYFAIPRYVELFDELPATSATMRVQKQELRRRSFSEHTWDLEKLGLVVPRDERR